MRMRRIAAEIQRNQPHTAEELFHKAKHWAKIRVEQELGEKVSAFKSTEAWYVQLIVENSAHQQQVKQVAEEIVRLGKAQQGSFRITELSQNETKIFTLILKPDQHDLIKHGPGEGKQYRHY